MKNTDIQEAFATMLARDNYENNTGELKVESKDDVSVLYFKGFYPIALLDENDKLFINTHYYLALQEKVIKNLINLFSESEKEELNEFDFVNKVIEKGFDGIRDNELFHKKLYMTDLVNMGFYYNKNKIDDNYRYRFFGRKIERPNGLVRYYLVR
jgi:hypothetical protein